MPFLAGLRYTLNQKALKFSIIVLPLVSWRDSFDGIPMLNDPTISNAVEIIKRRMSATMDTLTNGKHEAAVGEHRMIA